MLQKSYGRTIIKQVHSFAHGRRQLQALSAEILGASKRAIFSFHRDDARGAETQLNSARHNLKKAHQLIRQEPRLLDEGAWKAAQEEFAEADLLAQYLTTGKIGRVKEIADNPELFIGALSDLTGELLRRAVLLASRREPKPVEKIFNDVRAAVEFLLQMDLTGYLRTKLDQAKQNLRKIEEIRYDLTIRQSHPNA